MKVQSDQLAALAAMVENALADKGETLTTWENKYVFNKVGKDPKVRARWDALWAVPHEKRAPLIDQLYAAGCNDSHLDTALRHIFK